MKYERKKNIRRAPSLRHVSVSGSCRRAFLLLVSRLTEAEVPFVVVVVPTRLEPPFVIVLVSRPSLRRTLRRSQ